MKKYYNVLFPIWLILIFPPVIFLLIPGNFIIDSIVLLITLKCLKTSIKETYLKTIIKVVITGFLSDIIGALFLVLGLFLPDIISQNIPWNPFNNILSVLYVIIAILISSLSIYFINKKWSFKDNPNKHIISLALAIFTAPFLFLVPSSLLYYNYNEPTISDFKGITITDNDKMKDLFRYVAIDDLEKIENKNLFINFTDDNTYNIIEEEAATLFNIIKDLNSVTFINNNKNYYFDKDYFNKIYSSDIYELDYYDMSKRYLDENFEHTYYGRVLDYDLFNSNDACSLNRQILFEDDNYIYYVNCSSVNDFYLVKNNETIKLVNALKTISIKELDNTILEITKESK